METTNNRIDLYPEALRMFKKGKLANLVKIRELLNHQFPNSTESIDDAIIRLKEYRRKEGKKMFIIGVILLPLGLLFASFIWNGGGIIDMAILGGLIGGGLGCLIKGAMEYTKMK